MDNSIDFYHKDETLFDIYDNNLLFVLSDNIEYNDHVNMFKDKVIAKVKFVCRTNTTKLKTEFVTNYLYFTTNYLFISYNHNKKLPFPINVTMVKKYWFDTLKEKNLVDNDDYIKVFSKIGLTQFDYDLFLTDVVNELIEKQNVGMYLVFLKWVSEVYGYGKNENTN